MVCGWHPLGFLSREIGFAEIVKIEFYQAKLNYETDSWDLFEALNNGESIVVIDARSPESYALEHIPTAINIPHRRYFGDFRFSDDLTVIFRIRFSINFRSTQPTR